MIITPSSFTYERLSSLKFKELQKLSAQFHVNKRWAKKQELIENLLALKEKNETVVEDEQEWRDANTVFSDLKFINENKGNKRLTYNVTSKSCAQPNDPHLTFEVPQNGQNLLCETVYSRETYDIPPSGTDLGVEFLKNLRATFEILPKKKLTHETNPKAALEVSENGGKPIEKVTINENKTSLKKIVSHLEKHIKEVDDFKLKQGMGYVKKFDIKSKNEEQKKEKEKPEVKLLTIPHARVTKRIRAGETSGNEKSPIKMSRKSINIKKSTRLSVSKEDFMKSPFSSVQKSISKQTIIQSLSKNQPGKVMQNKVPIRLQFLEEKCNSNNGNNKENAKKILRKQLPKTANEATNIKPNSTKVNFNTSAGPSSTSKNHRIVALKKATLKKDAKERLNASVVQTPSNKPVSKPMTTTKMPDFSKIHKRHFEQMDSLHDYLKKKEDRIHKLFGTPQPGQKIHNLNKSAPVFHFQSMTATEEENNRSEDLKRITGKTLKKKENDLKFPQKKEFKSKLRTDIKDKNRSHIHGVRTNKRFELQMKFRKM